jgi:hypothetical protein
LPTAVAEGSVGGSFESFFAGFVAGSVEALVERLVAVSVCADFFAGDRRRGVTIDDRNQVRGRQRARVPPITLLDGRSVENVLPTAGALSTVGVARYHLRGAFAANTFAIQLGAPAQYVRHPAWCTAQTPAPPLTR